MDPNVALRLMQDCLRCRNGWADELGLDVDEVCEDLMDWLNKGGFEPDWEKFPSATEYYKRRVEAHRKAVK